MRRQYQLLRLPRGKLYYEPKPSSAAALQRKEKLMEHIDFWHTKMPYLGIRKLVQKLQEDGYSIGRKLVRRLMASMGVYTIYPKKNLSKQNFTETIVPYLLRNNQVFLPNQV